jgi:hypothetical protein
MSPFRHDLFLDKQRVEKYNFLNFPRPFTPKGVFIGLDFYHNSVAWQGG